MRGKRLLGVVLVVSMLLTMCGLVGCSEDENSPTIQLAEPLPTDPESLLARIDFTVLTDETFFQLQEYADALLTQKTEVNLVRVNYVNFYILSQNEAFQAEMTEAGLDEPFTLYTKNYAKHKKEMQYLIILDQLLKQYEECVIHGDYKYKPEFSRNPFPILLICPSYLTSDYDSMEEFFEAMDDGSIPVPEDAYEVRYSSERIKAYDTREELVLFPDEE